MVWARSGDGYSGVSEWSVCWYAAEVLAQAHADKAQERADEILDMPFDMRMEAVNAHDPYFSPDVDIEYGIEILERGNFLDGCTVDQTEG